MRFWLCDERTKSVSGPHLVMVLKKIPGFGPESRVAPAGSQTPSDWKPAKDYEALKPLFAPAEPPADKKPKP